MNKTRQRVVQILVLTAIAGGALALFLLARSARTEEAPPIPRPVRVERPQLRVLETSVEGWGNLRSVNQVTVMPRVPGTVSALWAEVGDTVEEGALLAEIDREYYRLELERSEAARAAASSAWQRADRLYKGGNASRQDWENARAAHLASEAQTAAARLRYEWTLVEAPTTGVVLRRHVNTGSLVSPEAAVPLYTIGSLDNLEVEVHLPEALFQSFAFWKRPEADGPGADGPEADGPEGSAVELKITADAFPDLSVAGEIYSVAPWVDPATRSFAVVCRVRDAGHVLRPGMLVRVEFVTESAEVLCLPQQALTGGNSLWVVGSDNRVSSRRLEEPRILSGFVTVPENLRNETCVVEGQHFLEEGESVRKLEE